MKPTHDIFGSPIVAVPKCAICGKDRGNHKARTLNCPMGFKHRTVGYTWFANTVYTPKEKK